MSSGAVASLEMMEIQRQSNAAVKIQATFRGYAGRRQLKKEKSAAIRIQTTARRKSARYKAKTVRKELVENIEPEQVPQLAIHVSENSEAMQELGQTPQLIDTDCGSAEAQVATAIQELGQTPQLMDTDWEIAEAQVATAMQGLGQTPQLTNADWESTEEAQVVTAMASSFFEAMEALDEVHPVASSSSATSSDEGENSDAQLHIPAKVTLSRSSLLDGLALFRPSKAIARPTGQSIWSLAAALTALRASSHAEILEIQRRQDLAAPRIGATFKSGGHQTNYSGEPGSGAKKRYFVLEGELRDNLGPGLLSPGAWGMLN